MNRIFGKKHETGMGGGKKKKKAEWYLKKKGNIGRGHRGVRFEREMRVLGWEGCVLWWES